MGEVVAARVLVEVGGVRAKVAAWEQAARVAL